MRTAKEAVWYRFTLVNNTGADREFYIQTAKTGYLTAWTKTIADSGWQVQRSGSLLKLHNRVLPSNTSGLLVQLHRDQPVDVVVRFQDGYSLYHHDSQPLVVQPLARFERTNTQRLLWQGLFLGIILVMALYNLFIYFAVKDPSYLYYVLSLAGIGAYFSFYYGIGMEYVWPGAPLWDTYCFLIIVPFNGLMRIYFTKTYLHTSAIMPRTNKVLNALAWLCGGCMAAGITSYLLRIDVLGASINVIGILGTFVLFMMLISGLIAYYREKYEPAQYFIWANILLVIGGTLFIVREMHLIPDTFLTRYFVQIGTLIQVIVFALGLASRFNQTRTLLAREILEKERLALEREIEKKDLIESQKQELEHQVARQTKDLKVQNTRLEDTVQQLRASELKLTQLNELKDKLFSIISHDLRNPLATMQSTLKLITEHHTKLTEEEKAQLSAEAQASLDNLNQLLYNLLQWSRSQMNLLQFKQEKIPLYPLLEKCKRVLQLNAHMKRIRIHVVAEEDLLVLADREMLEFVVRNLLSNAIKFSHRDSDVYVKASRQDEGVKIQVLDSGVGIHPSRIQKLLQLQASGTRRGTEKEKGTGLGLLISKDFIEKNGGRLEIESEPGKGSCFSFGVPGLPVSITEV